MMDDGLRLTSADEGDAKERDGDIEKGKIMTFLIFLQIFDFPIFSFVYLFVSFKPSTCFYFFLIRRSDQLFIYTFYRPNEKSEINKLINRDGIFRHLPILFPYITQ